MNVAFVDFDGVLDTNYYKSREQVEEKIRILADICHTFDLKVVIEASAKRGIDMETLEIIDCPCSGKSEWLVFLYEMFKKYNIEIIGRTPDVKKYLNSDKYSYFSMWKEYEILLYLMWHPEIEHFVVIDDDDLRYYKNKKDKSDLNRVREYLVTTEDYLDDNPTREGLLPEHKELVGEILKKENKVRRLLLKYKKNN